MVFGDGFSDNEMYDLLPRICGRKLSNMNKGVYVTVCCLIVFQILRWHTKGLPQDSRSIENAIIIRKSHHWPLLIDPQGQATL